MEAQPPLRVPRPIRVAFVLHSMGVAGAEMLVVETIHRLGPAIRPVVFCLDAIGPLGTQLQSEGVEVTCLNRRPGRDFGVAWRLARGLRRTGAEVIHAHQYTPFFYAALAKIASGTFPPLILTEHGRHYPDRVPPVRRAMNRLLLDRWANAVNAVCVFSAQRLTKLDGFAGARIEVIANGIDVGRSAVRVDRALLRQRFDLPAHRRYIINVARFHPVKDQAMLVRAFAVVADTCADVDLLLVGAGGLRADLETSVRNLNLAGRVRFLGIRRDVPELLQAADVFALTSLSEAASLTLLEAMAAGLPVVVTDVGGNPEIVRQGVDGLLVPRGDAAAAARALLTLLNEPAQAAAMGAAGAARVRAHFRIERTVGAYYALYRRLAGRA